MLFRAGRLLHDKLQQPAGRMATLGLHTLLNKQNAAVRKALEKAPKGHGRLLDRSACCCVTAGVSLFFSPRALSCLRHARAVAAIGFLGFCFEPAKDKFKVKGETEEDFALRSFFSSESAAQMPDGARVQARLLRARCVVHHASHTSCYARWPRVRRSRGARPSAARPAAAWAGSRAPTRSRWSHRWSRGRAPATRSWTWRRARSRRTAHIRSPSHPCAPPTRSGCSCRPARKPPRGRASASGRGSWSSRREGWACRRALFGLKNKTVEQPY